ncbi:MAG: hypothetical protein M1829_006221 [Trizodia sp. TS-e1964]|nr:MAG: hypothetical protein M1829_006221 [Trizodia sp. TS-e1964]
MSTKESKSLDGDPEKSRSRAVRDLFSIPKPIKRLFEKFPLSTYEANQLPSTSIPQSYDPTLYIFTTVEDSKLGAPSFNPTCLKWQTYLKFCALNFRTVASSNHASPTGVLPFLLPGRSSAGAQVPVPSTKLPKLAFQHGQSIEEPASIRYEAYMSLLDSRLRDAWLYNLYLEPANFSAVAYRLYVAPCSSNSLVRFVIARQLRIAAEAEIIKSRPLIDPQDIYNEASRALEALSAHLGADNWFFNAEQPGLFDASVFAYTHLLLDENLGWAQQDQLAQMVRKSGNLVSHRNRILSTYFRSCITLYDIS